MFILHVDSYRARAMFALRSRAVKKPYGASLNHAKLLECSGSVASEKAVSSSKRFILEPRSLCFLQDENIINRKILSQGAIFNRE